MIKIEPPSGDPVEHSSPAWYAEATAAQTRLRLDLKTVDGVAAVERRAGRRRRPPDGDAPGGARPARARPRGARARAARDSCGWRSSASPRPARTSPATTSPTARRSASSTRRRCRGCWSPTSPAPSARSSALLALLLGRERGGAGALRRGRAVGGRRGIRRRPTGTAQRRPAGIAGGGDALYGLYQRGRRLDRRRGARARTSAHGSSMSSGSGTRRPRRWRQRSASGRRASGRIGRRAVTSRSRRSPIRLSCPHAEHRRQAAGRVAGARSAGEAERDDARVLRRARGGAGGGRGGRGRCERSCSTAPGAASRSAATSRPSASSTGWPTGALRARGDVGVPRRRGVPEADDRRRPRPRARRRLRADARLRPRRRRRDGALRAARDGRRASSRARASSAAGAHVGLHALKYLILTGEPLDAARGAGGGPRERGRAGGRAPREGRGAGAAPIAARSPLALAAAKDFLAAGAWERYRARRRHGGHAAGERRRRRGHRRVRREARRRRSAAGERARPAADPLAELERRREHALGMGGAERIARHHASGRLTARERLERR